jgi:hypothetical protein
MMWITGKTKQIPKIVSEKKSFGGTFCFSNCHIIGLDTGVVVFLVSVLTCYIKCAVIYKKNENLYMVTLPAFIM